MGNRIYGCDICQEVCPFNVRFAEETTEPRYASRGPGELPAGVEALPGEPAVEVGVPEGERPMGAEASGFEGSTEAASGSRSAHPPLSAETGGGRAPAHPGTESPSLVELMRMTREEWDVFSRGSAIRRAGYVGFRRNVAVAMGNWLAGLEDAPPEAVVRALHEAMDDEEEELVREHAAWALDQAGLDGSTS